MCSDGPSLICLHLYSEDKTRKYVLGDHHNTLFPKIKTIKIVHVLLIFYLVADSTAVLNCFLSRLHWITSLTVAGSLTTEAVRPAADEPFPEVYTPIGDTCSTNLSSWDLAVPGSPNSSMFMSPLRFNPSGILFLEPAWKMLITSDSKQLEISILNVHKQWSTGLWRMHWL